MSEAEKPKLGTPCRTDPKKENLVNSESQPEKVKETPGARTRHSPTTSIQTTHIIESPAIHAVARPGSDDSNAFLLRCENREHLTMYLQADCMPCCSSVLTRSSCNDCNAQQNSWRYKARGWDPRRHRATGACSAGEREAHAAHLPAATQSCT